MFEYVKNTLKKVIFFAGNLGYSLISFAHRPSAIYDLTLPITSKTRIFPGDPEFKTEAVESLEKGSTYNLCVMHMGNHMGTHIDFPAHVIRGGKTSSDFPVQSLIGPGIVIEVAAEETKKELEISREFIRSQKILKNDFVFFKTTNSELSSKEFTKNFVHLSVSAADELINKNVKIVGIDYLSVDGLHDEKLSVHHKLLSKDILIVENLNLKNVPNGRFREIAIAPLNVPDMDGLPVRVLARR